MSPRPPPPAGPSRRRLVLAPALAAGVAAATLAAETRPADPAVPPRQAAMDRLFAGREAGWLAADGAYSARLTAQTVLWSFGDSVIGRLVEGGRKREGTMVNNALALQFGDSLDPKRLRFYWGPDDPEGKPTAFFRPPASAAPGPTGKAPYFWPFDMARVGPKLVVFLMEIVETKAGDLMGFAQTGAWMAVVDDPTISPRRWRPRLTRLSNSLTRPDRQHFYGAALLRDGAHLYIYGYDEVLAPRGGKRPVLARVPEAEVEDLSAWRYFDGGGWHPDPARAAPLGAEVAAEFTVDRLADGRVILVTSTKGGVEPGVEWRLAPGPAGPFGPASRRFDCPEAATNPNVFCYSAKAHAEQRVPPGYLAISYCTNAKDFWGIFTDPSLYVPRFRWERLP